MTRLIFTCLVLLISLMAIQYTIWSGNKVPTTEQVHQTPMEFHQVRSEVTYSEYMLRWDSTGKVIVVKRDVAVGI